MVHDLHVQGHAEFTFIAKNVMQYILGKAYKQSNDQCTVYVLTQVLSSIIFCLDFDSQLLLMSWNKNRKKKKKKEKKFN